MTGAWVCVLGVGLLLATGCLDGPAHPARASPPDPSAATGIRLPGDASISSSATSAVTTLTVDARHLNFTNALRQYALVADSPVNASLDWKVSVNAYGGKDACFAGAVTKPSGNGTAAEGVSLIVWQWRNELRTSVGTLGQEATVVPNQFGGATGGEVSGAIKQSWMLRPGERLLLQAGGSDPAFVRARHGISLPLAQNEANMSFAIVGRAHLEALPDVSLRCGAGLEQLERSTLSVRSVAYAGVGGAVELSTTGGASMVFQANTLASEAKRGTLTFLGDTVPISASAFRRSSAGAGLMKIEIEEWVEPVPATPIWFLAATPWPLAAQ